MSAPFKYNITTDDGKPSSITVFFLGEPLPKVATVQHKAFKDIVAACKNPDTSVDDLKGMFNVGHAVVKKFHRVTDRVSIAGSTLFFDNDPVDNAIAEAVVAFYAEGHDNLTPLVLFFEKLWSNPNKHSREQLYTWMANESFAIAPDGDLIGYKGVEPVSGRAAEDLYRSSGRGRAIVNGEVHQGQIPTSPGCVVEMPRSEVNHNPSEGCSTGLHVGTWGYAKSWGSVVLRVKVNPRDVVSVPTDCGGAKMRVCRYRVLGKINRNEVKGDRPDGMFHPHDELRTLAMEAVEPEAVAKSRIEAKAGKKKGRRRDRVADSAKIKSKARRLKEHKFPKWYEDFTVTDFRRLETKRLDFLLREWDIAGRSKMSRDEKIQALGKAASAKRREAKKYAALTPGQKRQVAKEDKPQRTRNT